MIIDDCVTLFKAHMSTFIVLASIFKLILYNYISVYMTVNGHVTLSTIKDCLCIFYTPI